MIGNFLTRSPEAQCSRFYIATAEKQLAVLEPYSDTFLLYTFHQLTTNTLINVSNNDIDSNIY